MLLHPGKSTRRSFLAAAIALAAGRAGATAHQATPAAVTTPRPTPITIGEGLSVLDIRAFPTPDVPRFIMELHSERDDNIDSIAIGTLLANDTPVWAAPVEPVHHAGSSTLLVGVLPESVTIDQMASATWEPCAQPLVSFTQAEKMKDWDVSIENSREVISETHFRYLFTVTNDSSAPTWGTFCQGLVWDGGKRLCGVTATMNLSSIEPGDVRETVINISPAVSVIASPFVLVDRVDDATATFSLQPTFRPVQPGCAPVMPWNT